MDATILALTDKLYDQQPLSQDESQILFDAIIKGDVDPIALSAILTALKIKGETPAELAGAAKALLANANPFPRPDYDLPISSVPVVMGPIPSTFLHGSLCGSSLWRESRQAR
ncbi:anthranilate phosphoribosyltransferase [Photobacterium aphoticum]|uniref:Anthranilate phosphoribosyltransferase n=1 Tax=Photobacterium aphoticum TaxID=754436 RepID=A0A090QSF6_9GAMM|nr:anthranilate phosphoribosyltransferase [Photobacterium aphoticum]